MYDQSSLLQVSDQSGYQQIKTKGLLLQEKFKWLIWIEDNSITTIQLDNSFRE